MSSESYLSIGGRGEGRYEEKRSVFLSVAMPVKTEEDAISCIDLQRKVYPDAKHHVYAYLLRRGNITRYSDDGEPQGTGGMPVLDCMRKSGLTDCVVVVTRYFGGILLGTGGLVHAYTEGAKSAILDAGIVRFRLYTSLSVSVSYPDYQKILPFLSRNDVYLSDTQFTDIVTVSLSVSSDDISPFCADLRDITGGRAEMSVGESLFDSRAV